MNWIVCPVRNALPFTKAALPTFLAQDIGDISVLLIDNDSSDGTTEWARSEPGISVFWHRRPPLSVAQSWNLALGWLFRWQRVDYALVVNNDVELRSQTYRMLVEDGGPFVTAVGVNNREQFGESIDVKNKRPHPDFSCYLIRKECWEKVGKFDECFDVAFYEDNSYHVRMHRAGVNAYCIGVPFLHHASGTIKSATPEEVVRIADAAGSNKQKFFEMYGCYPATPEYDALFIDSSLVPPATVPPAGSIAGGRTPASDPASSSPST